MAPKVLAVAAIAGGSILLSAGYTAQAAAAADQAHVTRIVQEVKLLPDGAKPKPASINDEVNADTGVRTGDRSRSELTFTDLTIERLGANTLFHFDKAGRQVQLENGSMLLRVPKDSGGAQMRTPAVTVGITGTTLILESRSAGRNKLIVLEGGARLTLNRYPKESVVVHGGQMEDVPAGATKLPVPVNINLKDVMQHHPLITDFGPLPSQDQIYATMQSPPTGPAPGPGVAIIPPIIGNVIGINPAPGGGPRIHQPRKPSRDGRPSNASQGEDGEGTSVQQPVHGVSVNSDGAIQKRSPTPPPRRKPKGR